MTDDLRRIEIENLHLDAGKFFNLCQAFSTALGPEAWDAAVIEAPFCPDGVDAIIDDPAESKGLEPSYLR